MIFIFDNLQLQAERSTIRFPFRGHEIYKYLKKKKLDRDEEYLVDSKDEREQN